MSRSIEMTVRIDARPETVWRFLVDGARLAEWWGPADVDPRPGGRFVVHMQEEGGESVVRGEILELEPPHRLVLSFGWDPGPNAPALAPSSSHTEIVLQADGSGTCLRVRHSGLPDDVASDIREGWDSYLPRLRTAAERAATRHDGRESTGQ